MHDETVIVPSVQEFLQAQYEALEKLKAEDEKAERKSRKGAPAPTGGVVDGIGDDLAASTKGVSNPRMAEHIGPYQINVNGIDFDAEEATRRLRERESERHASSTTTTTGMPASSSSAAAAAPAASVSTPMRRMGSEAGGGEGVQTPSSSAMGANASAAAAKQSNEAMSQFFANLINKKEGKRGVASAGASPTRVPPGSASASPAVRGSGGEERRRES